MEALTWCFVGVTRAAREMVVPKGRKPGGVLAPLVHSPSLRSAGEVARGPEAQ